MWWMLEAAFSSLTPNPPLNAHHTRTSHAHTLGAHIQLSACPLMMFFARPRLRGGPLSHATFVLLCARAHVCALVRERTRPSGRLLPPVVPPVFVFSFSVGVRSVFLLGVCARACVCGVLTNTQQHTPAATLLLARPSVVCPLFADEVFLSPSCYPHPT